MSTATIRPGASAQIHSPLFLASFAAFIVASALGVGGVLFSIATGTVQDWVSYWANG
ncbi:MAG: hypothetical protein QOJ51_4562, partial [Acidobacteriaceae bacterium]|nr:hypothetical protein [Acidobacteriaceae bacterium]